MVFLNYKENEKYGKNVYDIVKMSARERNIKERLALFLKTGIIPPADVLEIGSHEGLFLKMAKEKGFNVLGIEPNIYAVKHSVENGVATIQGYFEEVFDKIKNRKFDIVALFHVLEHMPDYLENLKKIKTLMNPGGYLIIEVPNSESYRSKKYGDDWIYVYEEHLHNFFPKKIKKNLEDLGFVIKNIHIRDFDFGNLSIKALLDRLLPFRFGGVNIKNVTAQERQMIRKIPNQKTIFRLLLFPIKIFLLFCVKILHRGDFIMVVAKSAQ